MGLMTSGAVLAVLREGRAIPALELSDRPALLGRDPGCDLVLPDAQVSWHHAHVRVVDGRVLVRDLGSSNGTWVAGRRIQGEVEVRPGQPVRLGPAIEVVVDLGAPAPGGRAGRRAWCLEDLASGVRYPLQAERVHLGGDADAIPSIPGLPAGEEAVLLVHHEDGEVWLGRDGEDRLLEPGETFEVGGRRFRLVEVPPLHEPTAMPDEGRYRWRLTVTLDGPAGAEAVVEDLARGLRHVVEAENRVVLLYILARRLLADREAGAPPARAGWCPESEVVVGVWGRGGESGDPNKLNVLVHRLRKELKLAGFDPWFIERKRRHLRIRVAEVVLR